MYFEATFYLPSLLLIAQGHKDLVSHFCKKRSTAEKFTMVLTVSSELPPVSVLCLGKSLPKDLICPKDVKEGSSGVGYEVKELPGRGSGLIATKNFYPGDLIMREHPIINMPDKVFRLGP